MKRGLVRLDQNCCLQDQKYDIMMRKLIEEVKCLLSDTADTHEMLELIDRLEKLGLAYHFEPEIKNALHNLASSENFNAEKNLHTTALWFLILRKHGYHVSQGIHIQMLITFETQKLEEHKCHGYTYKICSVTVINYFCVINYVWCNISSCRYVYGLGGYKHRVGC